MATTCGAPAEPPVEKSPTRIEEPESSGFKQSIRDLLVAIFKGHEEFLGWTPPAHALSVRATGQEGSARSSS